MSQSLPIVSVIMPCYNHGQYLPEAVGSVFAQTCSNFEIIIINDGSTDPATNQLLQDYRHPLVTVIHTENRGPAAARNTGIARSRGKYILPLDADDRIAPTYLEKAIAILDADPAVGIVYSQVEFFGSKTGLFDLPAYQFPQILLGNMICSFSFYRKSDWETVGGYRENMRHGWEDYDFWLSLIELGRKVVQIPESLCFYRQVPNSRSEQLDRDRQLHCYVQLFRNHPTLYSDHIQVLFQQLMDLRQNVQQTHQQLHLAQLQDVRLHAELQQLKDEVDQSKRAIARIQTSKFWKLRNQWFKLKQRFGQKIGD